MIHLNVVVSPHVFILTKTKYKGENILQLVLGVAPLSPTGSSVVLCYFLWYLVPNYTGQYIYLDKALK